MRVLHLTSTFPREQGGAGGSFLEELARAQAEAGLDVTVVAPHDAGLATAEQWGRVEVRRFRYGPQRWETLAYRGGLIGTARGLRGLVMVPLFIWGLFNGAISASRDRRIDVVHAHWWLPAGLAAVFVARRLGVPLVITCHGSDVALARRRFLVRFLARRVLRRAGTVATVSEALRAQVTRVAGVDAAVLRMPAAFPNTPPAPAIPTTGATRVVAVGRLSREKGFDVLLEALALAPAVRAELIGEGPELESLRACAKRLDLDQRLSISGALPSAEYLRRLQTADAVVVPSRHEGLGLVAVEALAAGRPVICSDVGGLPEAVAGAVKAGSAVLVPADDAPALAAALRDLPLPAPTPEVAAAAAAPHRPETVAAAHHSAYVAAARSDRVAAGLPRPKRRRPLRWLGAAAGLFLLAAVVNAVTDDLSDLREAVESPHLGWLAVALILALGAEIGFALASAAVGRSLVRPRPDLTRTAATYLVAQQAKHVPGGIWPAVARAGLSRRLHPGLGPRLAFVWVLGESLASVAAGLILGGGVFLAATRATPGPRSSLWAGLALAAGVGTLVAYWLARNSLVGRLLGAAGRLSGHPGPSLTRLAACHLPAWLATGAATAALAVALTPLSEGAGPAQYRVVAAAAVLASVAGFLALPVPAGIGVREAAFVALAATALSGPQALVIALAARLASLAAQITLAGAAWPLVRIKNEVPGNEFPTSAVDRIQADESG